MTTRCFRNCIDMPKISTNKLLPTTLVGSYPQPNWLIDRPRLAGIVPPRAHARELWHVDPSHLEQAQDDATILAIRDQERAGIDIVTDGEIRRESYSNRFATALDGMDSGNPAQIPSRTAGKVQIVPRVVGNRCFGMFTMLLLVVVSAGRLRRPVRPPWRVRP